MTTTSEKEFRVPIGHPGDVDRRRNKKRNYSSRFGKSTVEILCPFCDHWTKAYVWSLAGSGKKCQCGALHTRYFTIKK